jgi:kinetochore-associated protein 1
MRLERAEKIDEICDCLGKIDNLEFVVDYVLNFDSENANDVRLVLGCLGKLEDQSIEDALYLFGTFLFVQEYGWSWKEFKACSMILKIQTCVGKKDIKSALFLWKRHCFSENLLKYLSTILNEIPSNLNINDLLLILKEFRTSIENTTLEEMMEMYEQLDSWCLKTAETLEQIHHNTESAIILMKSCFSKPLHSKPTPFQQINNLKQLTYLSQYSNSSIQSELSTRIEQFEDIIQLEKDSGYKISYHEYSTQTISQIAIKMLMTIHSSQIVGKYIENYIKPFLRRHSIPLDEVLLEYCKDLMDTSEWESKVLVCHSLLSPPTSNEILLMAMRRTNIPWSGELDMLIQGEEFEEQLKLMKLKKMILKYGVENFNVSDINLAHKLVRFILRSDDFESTKDAMLCVEAYNNYSLMEILVLKSQWLIQQSMLARFKSLIKTGRECESVESIDIKPCDKIVVLKELLVWVLLNLEKSIKKERFDVTFLKAGVMICGLLCEKEDFQKQY